MKKVVYIMDPYCSWCYAGSANIQRLYEKYAAQIAFELIPASMLTHDYAFDYCPCMEAKQLAMLAQVEQKTGTSFGADYRTTLKKEDERWDSTLACAALEAVKRMDKGVVFAYANALLQARFQSGRSLQDVYLLEELAQRFGLNVEAFHAMRQSKEVLSAVEDNFTLVDEYADVYPTLVFETAAEKIRIEEGFAPYEVLEERLTSLLEGRTWTEEKQAARGCKNGVCSL